MTKLSQIAAAAVLALSFGGAQAAYVIDNFTAEQTAQIGDFTTNEVGVYAAPVQDAGILGEYRDVYVFKLGNSSADIGEGSGNFAGVTSSVFDGGPGDAWTYNEQSNQYGYGVVRWDGENATMSIDEGGLNGFNLASFGTSFMVDLLSTDAPLEMTLRAWTAVDGSTSYEMFSAMRTITAAGSYIFNFSDFGDANFANVGALELQLNSVNGAGELDAQVSQVSVVPEPGTLALAGLALLGMGAIRRRKS